MTPDEDRNALDSSGSESRSERELFSHQAHHSAQANPSAPLQYEIPIAPKVSDPFGNSNLNKEGLTNYPSVELNRNTTAGYSSTRRRSRWFILHTRFSSIQKALIISIAIVASMLIYALLRPPVKSVDGASALHTEPEETVVPPPAVQPAVADPPKPETEQTEELMLAVFPAQPRSIDAARKFYGQGHYRRAYSTYEQLLPALPASDHLLRDYLKLEMALCAKQAEDWAQAARMLASVCQSDSLAVRVMANYHLSLLEMQRKRFLTAGTRAYNALALIRAVGFDNNWASSFESDCHFLVAECLSRRVLFLSNVDANLPRDLWGGVNASDRPFDAFDGVELRRFLSSGSDRMSEALLDPLIRRVDYPSDLPRWSVISYGAPLEELIGKFAAIADIDVHWALKETSEPNSVQEAGRQRTVTLCLPAATSRQVVLTAVGCAGLLACVGDDPKRLSVTIYDPTEYSSLDDYLSLIGQQAISLWQTFILTFYNDKRLGNAHFVMGLLQSRLGQPAEALAEYKLVANRFSQTTLAPYALLGSGNVKSTLRDYHGAREDLKQLIERYPETEISEQAYWHLADATMKAGLYAEAARLYQIIHNLGFSLESTALSAFRAAKCLYETKAYEDAAKWLTRYIGLAGIGQGSTLYSAYFLLGQTNLALGKYQQACDAFHHVLVRESPREQYVEAVKALVRGHIEQEHFVKALNALEYLRSVTLSEEQSVEILLLKSKILRLLGLVDAAMISLQDRVGYVSDTQLSAKISFELALCNIAKGNLERARRSLSDILGVVEPGPLAHEVALALSDVCVKLDQDGQAVSVCLNLLDSDLPPETAHDALRTLAAAYEKQKDYNKAALALLGQWKQE
jgi:tetratricopeptide (TPR) repeat protein